MRELEERLLEVTNAKYAVAVSSGTAALHGACHSIGLKAGDEVITSPITFAASANCVLYTGAKPVFADIDPDTYNIAPDEIQARITDKTKGVIAVDFAGQAAELSRIRDICQGRGLFFIEDAAHSIGTKYNGEPIGCHADMTTFSFHPVKTVTGGEGGAVTTNDEALYRRLLLFRTHGITRDRDLMIRDWEGAWYYEQIDLGYNYRLTDFQSALIISQLSKLDIFGKRRREIVQRYDEAFSGMEEIILQKNIPDSDTVNHLYVIQLVLEKLNGSRREIFDALYGENICCNVHYIPVYTMPYYRTLGYINGLCPKAEALYRRILTIPLFYGMTDQDVDSVIEGVRKVIGYYRK